MRYKRARHKPEVLELGVFDDTFTYIPREWPFLRALVYSNKKSHQARFIPGLEYSNWSCPEIHRTNSANQESCSTVNVYMNAFEFPREYTRRLTSIPNPSWIFEIAPQMGIICGTKKENRGLLILLKIAFCMLSKMSLSLRHSNLATASTYWVKLTQRLNSGVVFTGLNQ